MKNRAVCAAILLAAALPLSGCSGKHEAGKQEAGKAAVVKGTVETVRSSDMPETIEVPGTVRAGTSAVVAARIPGTLTVLKVREGDRVQKGQVLAQLEAQESQASAAAAAAGMDEARQGVDEARTRKKLAESTFERYQKLFSEQAISRQEFDIKQSEKELAVQGLARAEARLRQAQESSRSVSAMSGYTRIVAPVSGIITSKPVDLGATVFPSQPLMTIEDEGSYLLELAVPESQASSLRSGTPVQVTLDALGNSFPAAVSEIVPAADPASRTFVAKISLARKNLKSGMFGRGIIKTGTTTKGITLPKKALIEHGAMTSVWIVDSEKNARMRLVKTGRVVGDRIEILSGLSDGEQVVVSAAGNVSEGAKVE